MKPRILLITFVLALLSPAFAAANANTQANAPIVRNHTDIA